MVDEFDKLKASSEFLNLLLDHINAAVLVVDENMRIHQFNQSFLDLFDRATDLPIHQTFGPISGCINAVQENNVCGATSQCQFCLLRKSLINTLAQQAPIENQRLERTFYINGTAVPKTLEFSSRPIYFKGNRMVLVILYDITSIETQKRELEKKQIQLDIDLQAAAEIQKSLLPKAPVELPGILTAWRFEPFQRVGGDIFQIYANGTDEISTYIIDVCGHGVSAAMVAVSVSQFLHSLQNRMRLTGKRFPAKIVMNRLDEEFPLDRFDCFFTAVYATLNVRTGCFTYSNAGHVPPVILRADGRLDILKQHGTVVGAGTGFRFEHHETVLNQRDRVFLYTDGLLDNFGPHGESDGKRLFYSALKELKHQSLENMVDQIFIRSKQDRVDMPLNDDISLLAFEYTG